MAKFKLTKNNYYSKEANQLYWSASFVKEMLDCPARAIAEYLGDYEREESKALLVGGFVDAAFEGPASLRRFKMENPSVFNSKTGELKADFREAQGMVERARKDETFMKFMHGQKQKIFTGTIMDLPFKCKLDVYEKGVRIVDLKTVKDMSPVYKPGIGKVNFAEAWNWPLQMAIYQELVRQNTGDTLPCYLAVITKETPPDIAVIEIPQYMLDAEMEYLTAKLPMMDGMRIGDIEPDRCDSCAYCRETKTIDRVISLDEFEGE